MSVIPHGSLTRIDCGGESYRVGDIVDSEKVFYIDDESSERIYYFDQEDPEEIHTVSRSAYLETVIEAEDGIIVRFENFWGMILRGSDNEHLDSVVLPNGKNCYLGDVLDGRTVTRIYCRNSFSEDVPIIIPLYFLRTSGDIPIKVLTGDAIATWYKPVEYF